MNDNGHPLANWRYRRARFILLLCVAAFVGGAWLVVWAMQAAAMGCPR
jgi:hypothetical protein